MSAAATLIDDFVEVNTIEVRGSAFKAHSGHFFPLVTIVQSAAGMRFQHSMRPEQARELASVLLYHADEAEIEAKQEQRSREEVHQ